MNNNPWQILGIAATDDSRAVKRAYARALKALDPDDRAGFIALRGAYEQALAWAAAYYGDEDDVMPDAVAAQQEAYHGADEGAADDAVWQEDGEGNTLHAAYEQALDNVVWQEDADNPPQSDAAKPRDILHAAYEQALDHVVWQEDADNPPQSDAVTSRDRLAAFKRQWAVESDGALLAVLRSQYQALQAASIAEREQYREALLQEFWLMEGWVPKAFAFADAHWDLLAGQRDFRVQELLARYGIFANPALHSYPALQAWEDNWQRGFWARLYQAIHPGRLRAAREELARLRHEYWGEADLPASVRALVAHGGVSLVMRAVIAFAPVLLLAFIFVGNESMPADILKVMCLWLYIWLYDAGGVLLKLAGKRLGLRTHAAAFAVAVAVVVVAPPHGFMWLMANGWMIAGFALLAVFWQRMLALFWRRQVGVPWYGSGFFGALLLFVWIATSTRIDVRDAPLWFYLLAVCGCGALFAGALLARVRVEDALRRAWASALLYGGILLPVLALAVQREMFVSQAVLLWGLKIFWFVRLYSLYAVPEYRRWAVALPLLAGFAGFAAAAGMPWSAREMLYAVMTLWLVVPLGVSLSPHLPRAAAGVLPAVLRSFGQGALLLCLPLYLVTHGYWLALPVYLGVAAYILWLDMAIDRKW